MLRRVVPAVLAGAAAVLTTVPATAATPADTTGAAVSFSVLGELPIPGCLNINGNAFGGLSGVDYDPTTGTWRASTDDSSDHGPARFYYLNLGTNSTALSQKVQASAVSANTASGNWFGISAGTTPLLRADGTQYPPSATAGQDTVHPEAIRYDPTTKNVFWANEGDNTSSLAVNPAIRQSGTNGSYVSQLTVSNSWKSSATTGIREGQGVTGLTFSSTGGLAVSTVAGPLVQDGATPTATKGAYTRITGQSRVFGWHVVWQYAYPLDALPLTDANGNGTNQVAGILAVDATHYLVLERATAPGQGNSVRLYEVNVAGATNVAPTASLNGATFTPVSKTLLLDFDSLNLPDDVANFSGLTWGPSLPDGRRTLVLVSNNGFDTNTSSDVLALAVSGI